MSSFIQAVIKQLFFFKKRLRIFIPFILLMFNGKANAQFGNIDPEALLRKMKETKIRSGAVAILEKGQIIYKKSFGSRDGQGKKRSDFNTLYNVASVSKSLTAWGVMKLVQDGKIALDEPINKYIKRGKAPLYKNDTTQITTRMLLSHTAGLNMSAVPEYPPGKIPPSLTESVKNLAVIQKPGESFRYSGGGFMLLQLLIEDVTSLEFEEYMQENILIPLRMNNSTFHIPGTGNVATPYDETLKAIPHFRYTGVGAAGLYTSLNDLSRFAVASTGIAPNPVLKKETLDMMKAANSKDYGLGYYRLYVDSALVLYGHSGAALGWRSTYYIDDAGNGIVLLCNSSFNEFVNLALCQWIKSVYRKESEFCKLTPYTSLFIDLFTKGKTYTKSRIEAIKKKTGRSPIDENFCNIMGYWMLRLDRLEGAKTFFELNIMLYPNNANVNDSMGEFYETVKDNKDALSYYRKAIALDSTNEHAAERIKALEE